MPGGLGPGRRVIGRPVIASIAPGNTAYTKGLSHFPDAPMQVDFGPLGINAGTSLYGQGLGDLVSEGTAVASGVAIGGPVGGAIAFGQQLLNGLLGGSQRDQQRQARANYFGQLAVGGNVAAAQMLLGSQANVAGDEKPMWSAWINQLQSSTQGQAILAAAQQAGPYWPVGSTDTVTNYPISKNFVAQWANSDSLAGAASTAATNLTRAIASSGSLPWLIVGGAVALFVFSGRRKR